MFEDRDEQSLLRIMVQADADVMCVGHTHKPYHRILHDQQGENVRFRHAVNIGAVGKPKDNDARGCYVILMIDEKSDMLKEDSVKVNFMRFH